MSTEEQPESFQAGRVGIISLCHFIHDVYSFLSSLLPLLIEKFSLTLTRAGFLSTVMQLPALLNPPHRCLDGPRQPSVVRHSGKEHFQPGGGERILDDVVYGAIFRGSRCWVLR